MRDIAKLGRRNDVVEVAPAYAVNVLIPKGEAKMATEAILNQIQQAEKSKQYKKETAHSTFLNTVEKLRTSPIIISGTRHEKGSLFAHITETAIAEAIHTTLGVSIAPKQIHLKAPIKHHGTYQITLEEGGKKEEVTLIVKE